MLNKTFIQYNNNDIELLGNWKIRKTDTYSILFNSDKTVELDYFEKVLVLPHLDCFIIIRDRNDKMIRYIWSGETYIADIISKYIIISYKLGFIMTYDNNKFKIYNYTLNENGLYHSDLITTATDIMMAKGNIIFLGNDNNVTYYDLFDNSFFKTFKPIDKIETKRLYLKIHNKKIEVYNKTIVKQKKITNIIRENFLLYRGTIYKKIGNFYLIRLVEKIILLNINTNTIIFEAKSLQQTDIYKIILLDFNKNKKTIGIIDLEENKLIKYNSYTDYSNKKNKEVIKLK